MSTVPNPALTPEVESSIHNANENTDAAQSGLCGMTHLATGRICLLPKRHSGGCDFTPQHVTAD
jgi:hypothetical protein